MSLTDSDFETPREYQQTKCYKWEHGLTLKNNPSFPLEKIQEKVNEIWAAMGLIGPPEVQALPINTKWLGTGTRMVVKFRKNHPTTLDTILHELAHAMCGSINGAGHKHDEHFVGVYMELMIKFMDIDRFYLWFTADKAKLQYEKFAKPKIMDGGDLY